MIIHKKTIVIVLLLVAAIQPILSHQDQIQEDVKAVNKSFRILALFSGIRHELGIDHRLGRQVLRLAQQRAQQLYPQLGPIELVVYSDPAACNALNSIPNRVAAEFYRAPEACPAVASSNAMKEAQHCRQLRQESLVLASILNKTSTSADKNRRPTRQEDQLGEDVQLRQQPTVDAILGPSCDHLVDLVARMAAYWRTPIYSVASIGAQFGRKHVYSTLTRLSPSIDHLSLFLLRTMNQFKWRHLAALADFNRPETRIVLDNLELAIGRQRLMRDGILERQLAVERPQVFSLASSRIALDARNSTGRLCSEEAREALLGAQRVARVLLLLVEPASVRGLLLCAYELGFNNGEYTFLALNLDLRAAELEPSRESQSGQRKAASAKRLAAADQQQQDHHQQLEWYSARDEPNNLLARQMFESLMVYSVELPLGDQLGLFVEQVLELVGQEYPASRFERSSVGPLAVALHDALLLACQAHLQQSKQPPRLAWGLSLEGGLMAGAHISDQGDQELDYVLSDLEPELGVMRPVARYSRQERQFKPLASAYIHWPMRLNQLTQQLLNNDDPPPDEPECGYTGDAERCLDRQSLHAFLATLAVLALLLATASLLAFHRYRQIKYQMKLDDYWWRIQWHELQFIQLTGSSLVSTCPQSVARAIQSGAASLIEVPSPAGGSSVVSVSVKRRDQSQQQQVASQAAAKLEVAGVGSKMGRRSALPTIVTSDNNNKLETSSAVTSAAHNQQDEDGNLCQARSALSSVVRSSRIAMFKRELVIVKQLNAPSIETSRELLVDLKSMRDHIHDNLARFLGLCPNPGRVSIVYEYCSRGSLQDMLLQPQIQMDWTLRYSILGDLVRGLHFIHSTQLDYHGRLKSSNLVLDSRFTLKITDFGLQSLYSQLEAVEGDSDEEDEEGEDEDNDENYINRRDEPDGMSVSARSLRQPRDLLSLSVSQRGPNTRGGSQSHGSHGSSRARSQQQQQPQRMALKNRASGRYFWTAPEHLRDKNVHFAGSKRGDIYSLAIILFELLTRREPYYYGTTAKPHWPHIRADRKQQQQLQLASQPSPLSKLAPRGSEAGSSPSRRPSGGSSLHRSRLRSSQVGPAATDAASIVSGHSQASLDKASGRLVERELELEMEPLGELETSEAGGGGRSGTTKPPGSETQQEEPLDAEEVLDQLRMGILPDPVRPYLPAHLLQEAPPKLVELMRQCWQEQAALRPNVAQLRQQLRRITKGVAARNYLDNLLDRLQNYAADLERIVDAKTGDIVAEKGRTEELLYQLVPKFVAERLKREEPIVPRLFEGVTIFFSDIVGFEKYASVLSPSELVDLLNSIYSSFDSIISSFDVTKIETIIDQFLVAAGISLQQDLPQPAPVGVESKAEASGKQTEQSNQQKQVAWSRFRWRSQASPSIKQSQDEKQQQVTQPSQQLDLEHYQRSSAEQIARMALCIRDLVKSTHFRQTLARGLGGTGNSTNEGGGGGGLALVASSFNIRIGIHSGRVCTGIVGANRPKFCLIGDTVNVASRMHTNSKANKIQISAATKQLLERLSGFSIEPRGRIEVKGKGSMDTYWLESAF